MRHAAGGFPRLLIPLIIPLLIPEKSLILIKIPDAESRNSRKSHYFEQETCCFRAGFCKKAGFHENVCFRGGFWKNTVVDEKSLILIKIPDAHPRNSRKSRHFEPEKRCFRA